MSWGNKEKKRERLVRMSMVGSVIKNVSEEGGKGFCGRAIAPFLAGGLALGILVAVAVNAANVPIHDDQKAVAELDTQYQAAVKKNDAATMDRLLADDFVPVTGSGKAYTKADLLKDARSGHVVYEHQEDTSQTVRVWGNTADVTPRSWVVGTISHKQIACTVGYSEH